LQVIAAPICARCGNPVEGRIDHVYECFHCTETLPRFDCARSAVRFAGSATSLIHDFKYHHAFWLQEDLADLLQACVVAHFGDQTFDAICAVPLHHVRRRERGFNQAALLAASLARRLQRPLRLSYLIRVRDTGTQTHLTARDRLTNVKGAFEARRPGRFRGQRLLLVDDVMTTGATVSACAGVLKGAGAASVHVVTLARGA
jgi:ComF family protein